jgi:cullin-associated NEDD8-dissociated protein 1
MLQSAYETLYALMETAFPLLSPPDLYDRIISGLSDDHDIRALCNLMLTKLITLAPTETALRLDQIAVPYRAVLSTKLKENAVKQEVEKLDEAIRGVLRVSLSLNSKVARGAGIGASQTEWKTYWEWVEKDFDGQLKVLKEEAREGRSA